MPDQIEAKNNNNKKYDLVCENCVTKGTVTRLICYPSQDLTTIMFTEAGWLMSYKDHWEQDITEIRGTNACY